MGLYGNWKKEASVSLKHSRLNESFLKSAQIATNIPLHTFKKYLQPFPNFLDSAATMLPQNLPPSA